MLLYGFKTSRKSKIHFFVKGGLADDVWPRAPSPPPPPRLISSHVDLVQMHPLTPCPLGLHKFASLRQQIKVHDIVLLAPCSPPKAEAPVKKPDVGPKRGSNVRHSYLGFFNSRRDMSVDCCTS